MPPPPGYVTVEASAQRLGATGQLVRHMCNVYRKRISSEPEADRVAHRDELACVWIGTGLRIVYFVQEASLVAHLAPHTGSGRRRGAADKAQRPPRRKEKPNAEH